MNYLEKYENKNYYFRGIDNLEDIKKNSIDILNPEMVNLSGGIEGIEDVLMNNNLDSWYIETLEDNSIKIEYEGVNALENYQSWIHDQYDYIAILEGDCLGENFNGDGAIISVKKVVAIYDRKNKKFLGV